MIPTLERLTLNPVEFVPERPQVSLHELGLEVGLEGLDYGESSITVERVRQAIGEGVTDRRWPSVEAIIPLIAKETKTVSLAEALFPVEATIAEIQRRGGGWIKRDFSDAGGFAGSVCCPIDAAAMTPAQGWPMAHRQFAPNMVLKLSRYPIWYATVETMGTEVKATGVRDLKWEISEMLGTAPGLIRVRVKNEGEVDWRGAMACIEADYLSTAATADLAYECEKLTLGSTASVKERAGASGGKVVRATLSAGRIKVLGSEIAGVGHMTHTGPRRMKLRAFDPSASVGTVMLQLESRALGASTWRPNKIVEAPLVGNFAIIDMGECRPELAVLGSQRWEWRVMAWAPGGSGEIDLDRVWPFSIEQMLVVSTPAISHAPDHQSAKPPGTVEDKEGIGTANWESPANAKASDDLYAVCVINKLEVLSHYLSAVNFGFSIPEAATISGVLVTLERRATGNGVFDGAVQLLKGGTVVGSDYSKTSSWPLADATTTYGGSEDLWGETWTPANVNSATFGTVIAASNSNTGPRTAKVDSITITVYYTEAIDDNKVCFATRAMEFRSDGVHRQHPSEDIWGRLIPEAGSIFLAPPGGLQKRAVRGIVVPSQGDLGVLADGGTAKPSVLPSYHAGYLSAREAA